ncbi:MAG: hypothetical protein MUE69_12405 [Myxococcota bacterium]|jgi:hypothetical protein|nr:hypothetical protein [Myxococcota bacterium]
MLIDASIHGPEAARALRRWRTGVVVGLVGSLLSSFAVWSLWYGDAGLEIDSVRLVLLAASGVGLVSSVLVYFGVRDYVAAMHGSFGALPRVVLGIELAFSGIGLGERALPVRTRGLKAALVMVVILGLLAKLGASFFGPLVAVLALGFALGALFTVFSYLRVVGDVSALLLERAAR